MTRSHATFVLWKDLERWIPPSRLSSRSHLPEGWKLIRLGDQNLVRQVRERVKVEPDQEYKMVGVRWYGEGSFHRETVLGKNLSATYVTPVVPGAFMYNRLFAWKASFAVVPPEHGGCFVSNEFPQFLVDETRLSARYLYLFFMCAPVTEAVNAASIGSAAVSRNRFKEEEFLGFRLPLPPLPVQQAIVARWESAQADIKATRAHLLTTEGATSRLVLDCLGIPPQEFRALPKAFAMNWRDLERWSVGYTARMMTGAGAVHKTPYPITTLGSIAQVSYGVQVSPANRVAQHARPYLRVANVQRGQLDLTKMKYINVPDADMDALRLHRGDLLVCEGNSADLVGRPAIWNDEIADCVHQNHILKVRVTREKALPEFVLEYMQTPPARAYFRARAKFTTNLASINSNDLREILIPLPPLNIQREMVQQVQAQRQEMARLQEQAERKAREIKAEVEALILGTKQIEEK